MLWEYCTTHIREHCSNCCYMCDIAILGYVSGKKCAKISWAQLCEDLSKWIKPECMPDGFKWADPSKIRIGDIFLLLEHWRERQRQGLTPLMWLTSGPLFEDVSLSADEHQEYHSEQSPDDRVTDNNTTEEGRNTSDSQRWSDRSRLSTPNPISSSDAGAPNPHYSDNPGGILDEQGNSQTFRIHSSDSIPSSWGGIDADSHMSSPPLRWTYSPKEGLGMSTDLHIFGLLTKINMCSLVGSPPYNITPTQSRGGSGSGKQFINYCQLNILIHDFTDRGGPSTGPWEDGFKLNDAREDDTGSNHPENCQNLSEDPFKITNVPKRTVKLMEKARSVYFISLYI